MPFYAWECITIQTKKGQVDLVIKDLNAIDDLIKYLVYKMKTIDGNVGTSSNLIKDMSAERIDELNRKTIMKYKILKFRMKISYIAFEKNITVKELFL